MPFFTWFLRVQAWLGAKRARSPTPRPASTPRPTGPEPPAPLKLLPGRPAGARSPPSRPAAWRALAAVGPRGQLLRRPALPERRRGHQRLRPVRPGAGRGPRDRPGRGAGVAGRHRAGRPLGPTAPDPRRSRRRVRGQPAHLPRTDVRGVHRRATAEPVAGQHRADRRRHRRGGGCARRRARVRHRHVRACVGRGVRARGGAAPVRRPR